MSRTKTPKDLATQQALTRIALLAAQIRIHMIDAIELLAGHLRWPS
jgi:hypothetical protein